MIPMEIRKIVVADYDEGMKVESISRVVRVSTSAIYRLLKKRQKTGTIEPSYEKSGRQSEVTAEKLAKRKALIAEDSDITLSEIKEAMHLSIQKSEISNILRNKGKGVKEAIQQAGAQLLSTAYFTHTSASQIRRGSPRKFRVHLQPYRALSNQCRQF